MSEEEKKAIQYLNKYCDTDLFYEQQHYNYIKMVIKLVGKQQKELEQEKEKNKSFKKQIKEMQEYYKNADFIFKDKIKEKIQELKEQADDDNFEAFVKIDILNELLEENNE